MRDYLRPASLLYYFFAFLVFFVAGTVIAGLAGVGEGQGLAAATIVMGYGVVTGFSALIAAVVSVKFLKHNHIKLFNKVIGIILALLMAFSIYRFLTSEPVSDKTNKRPLPKTSTAPAENVKN